LLRCSQNKLHVVLVDMAQDGQDTMLRVLGSYWMEDLENILIGLGLQALRYISILIFSNFHLNYMRLTFVLQYHRVHMADNTTHLFLTRTSKEAEDILWLLTASNFPQLTSSISLQRFGLFSLLLSL
jgi:hypothetical protein